MAAALLVLVTLMPLSGWPFGQVSAYAQTSHEPGSSVTKAWWTGIFHVLGVASSNENERKDREDRRERNKEDQDDNEGNENWSGPPPRANLYQPPPPPDQGARCLGAGGSLSIDLPGGGATVKIFQDNLYAELARVDPSSVPSPGNLVGQLIVRVTISPCGGQAFSTLPNEANLGVSYRNREGVNRDESAFVLVYFDGQTWSPTQKQANDPPNRYVSATIGATGIYALVQR
jgi:hypothetical protein